MKVRKKPQALVVGRGHAGLRERTCIPLHTTVSDTSEGENHAPKKGGRTLSGSGLLG